MTLYFVDTENLNGIWPEYVLAKYKQDSNCKFLIFATEKTSAIPWRFLDGFRKMRSSAIEFCEAHNGEKNALDFCLVARLGEEVAHSLMRNYVVVSKDKGFDSAIEYLNNRHNINIMREVSFDEPAPVPIKLLNSQRREKLATMCGVSSTLAEHIRSHLFTEKKNCAPYKDSLAYTINWIETSKASSFKSNPSLRVRLVKVLTSEYKAIMASDFV